MATLNYSRLYQGVNIALHGKFLKLYSYNHSYDKKKRSTTKNLKLSFAAPKKDRKPQTPLWDRNCPQKISIETRPGFDSP